MRRKITVSFSIDDETWEPQTAEEHAEAILEQINTLLQENNVTDSDGNVVQLKQSYGNALWLLALGDGNRFADNDEKLEAAINSFNIELCDDDQIENLLPIAAVSRNSGSYSTLTLSVTASEDGTCTIPAGTKAAYGDVNFVTQTAATISAGATQLIETVCDTIGPIAVLKGEIDSFTIDIANLASVTNPTSSTPGVAAETTSELRQRLINGDTIKYSLNGCKEALEALTGVSYAKIFFNYNTNETVTLAGDVVVQPRTAYMIIYGSSDSIAETYATYMSAPTQNSPIASGTYSTLVLTITASSDGDATIPSGTTFTYNGYTFATSSAVTISAGESSDITFTCTEYGAVSISAGAITALDTTIDNVSTVTNASASTPGTDDPRHSQNWITSSGQSIPVYYDSATELNVYVKVFLKSDADSGTQVDNQIKRDLITASADWGIGEEITSLVTSAPFIDCTYTDVAYTKVSTDGSTWSDIIEVGCNVIPRLEDATITVEQLEDE